MVVAAVRAGCVIRALRCARVAAGAAWLMASSGRSSYCCVWGVLGTVLFVVVLLRWQLRVSVHGMQTG